MAGQDSHAGWDEPVAPTRYLDAETTDRVINTVPIVLQRVKDPAVLAKLVEVLTELGQKLEPSDLATLATGAKQDAAQGRLNLLATQATLEAVRALLAGTLTADVSDRAVRLLGHVAVDSSSLPAGASTAAKQDTAQARLGLLAEQTTLEAARVLLASLDGKDYATQATLASRASETTLASRASETTLASRASETTLAALLAALTPTRKVAQAEASVASGNAFVTVAAFTPAAGITVVGFNADLTSLLNTSYRLRLITGTDAAPTILATEQISSTANSWLPLRLSVASGTRVAVQAVHGEVTSQTFRAAINYEE